MIPYICIAFKTTVTAARPANPPNGSLDSTPHDNVWYPELVENRQRAASAEKDRVAFRGCRPPSFGEAMGRAPWPGCHESDPGRRPRRWRRGRTRASPKPGERSVRRSLARWALSSTAGPRNAFFLLSQPRSCENPDAPVNAWVCATLRHVSAKSAGISAESDHSRRSSCRASAGQVDTQSPHPMHRFCSSFTLSPSAVRASIWQRSMQIRHPLHSSTDSLATKGLWMTSLGLG